MQALNVRNVEQVAKPELVNTVLVSADAEKSEEINQKKVADLNAKQSFDRFLEAYGDCV
jgi:hypothetical protein